MPPDPNRLGGRLKLFDPDALDPEQRETYDRCQRNAVPWAENAGVLAATEDGRLIGPFNGSPVVSVGNSPG